MPEGHGVAGDFERQQWARAKELARKVNIYSGPRARLNGVWRSTKAKFGYDIDVWELQLNCEVFGPQFAQIIWGRITNRVYDKLEHLLPGCDLSATQHELEFNIRMLEQISDLDGQ